MRWIIWVLLGVSLLLVGPRVPVWPQDRPRPVVGQPLMNTASPLARGRTHWWMVWPGWSGGGTLWRALWGADHGTLTGMSVPSTATSGWALGTTRRGAFGHLLFDGAGDYVTVGTGPLRGATTYTISVWARVTAVPGADVQFVSRYGSGQYAFYVGLQGGSGVVIATTYSCVGNNATSVSGATNLADGVWHQIVHVFVDTVRHEVFVDGVSVGVDTTFAETYCSTSTQETRFGGSPEGGTMTGSLDDVQLFHRALTTQDIAAHYREGRTGYPTTLLAPPLVTGAPGTPAVGRRPVIVY